MNILQDLAINIFSSISLVRILTMVCGFVIAVVISPIFVIFQLPDSLFLIFSLMIALCMITVSILYIEPKLRLLQRVKDSPYVYFFYGEIQRKEDVILGALIGKDPRAIVLPIFKWLMMHKDDIPGFFIAPDILNSSYDFAWLQAPMLMPLKPEHIIVHFNSAWGLSHRCWIEVIVETVDRDYSRVSIMGCRETDKLAKELIASFEPNVKDVKVVPTVIRDTLEAWQRKSRAWSSTHNLLITLGISASSVVALQPIIHSPTEITTALSLTAALCLALLAMLMPDRHYRLFIEVSRILSVACNEYIRNPNYSLEKLEQAFKEAEKEIRTGPRKSNTYWARILERMKSR